ncbi:MAG: DDE-type integrase/transposase/recombinase [Actinomycetota bacterium]|nr:DDE-type integrase/transposase/recombinase [Actinomycetota bacterium]
MDREARRCAIARINQARAVGAAVSPLVAGAAVSLGVGERTVWRWLQAGVSWEGESHAWRPADADIDAYVRWKGNGAAAWRERRAASPATPSLRSFQTAMAACLGPGGRATVRDGVKGRRAHQVYLLWEPEARNELWEADHKELDVKVVFPRSQRPKAPWVTLFVDGCSRAIMGWAISDYPSAATVLAALGEAIRVDERCQPFGGLPAAIRPDGGLEFAADALKRAAGTLAIRLLPTPPYSPNLKGKVERANRSIVTQLLAELPGFTGGPRDAAGKLWGKGLAVLTLAEFVDRFDTWVRWYNHEHSHASLAAMTPLQRWSLDATPLRTMPDQELRWTLLGEKQRTIRTSGVAFGGLNYVAPELNGLVGEIVQVRFRPHDARMIEVFRGGAHLCTAKPQGTLDADERAAVLARRRADVAEQAARQRRAVRSARARLAPVTGPGPLEDTTVIPIRAASTGPGRDGDELRTAARADLLGLPSGAPC